MAGFVEEPSPETRLENDLNNLAIIIIVVVLPKLKWSTAASSLTTNGSQTSVTWVPHRLNEKK